MIVLEFSKSILLDSLLKRNSFPDN